MSDNDNREVVELNGLAFSWRSLPSLVEAVRQCIVQDDVDIQIIISFPEAAGYLTRPLCRGGPNVRVSLSAPVKQKDILDNFAGYIKKRHS